MVPKLSENQGPLHIGLVCNSIIPVGLCLCEFVNL